MSDITDRILAAIQQSGLSYTELSKLTKVSRSALQRYAMGETDKIPITVIEAVANATNVDAKHILGWDTEQEDLTPYNPVMHKIPILGDIAAGLPIFAEQNIVDYMYTELNGGNKYFALKVKGDSMNAASIPDGSTVVVRQQEKVENGEIAAVRVNNDSATVKRFKQNKNIIQLVPQSYNPEHEIQIYDLKKDKIDILGKVVECKTVFN